MKNVYVHPKALAESRKIGDGSRVWAFAHIMAGARLGRDCNVGDHCFIESGSQIGNGVTIKNGNMIWEGVVLADGVFVGPHVFFTNDLHPRSPRLPQARRRYAEKRNWLLPTRIDKGATLGAGAIILAGITVGEYALVGAGAVVTKSVPPHALVIGNPARLKGWVCMCGESLRFRGKKAACSLCRQSFRITKGGPRADRNQ